MSGKLSPPLLASTIPAFYKNAENGIVITIPFSMNRAVSAVQIKGFQVKIKTMQSGDSLYISDLINYVNDDEIRVSIPDAFSSKFKPGQFYKFQVAYVDTSDIVGYYSAVAVGKCTTEPKITIQTLNKNILNTHLYEYSGVYSQQDGDITERVYSYCFNLYDNEGKLISTSGNLLHNSETDDLDRPYESIDHYTFAQDLVIGQSYKIEYVVTTVHNLVMRSSRYRITQKSSISPELNATLMVQLNYENGYIDLNLQSANNVESDELVSGFFIVSRACEETNYSIWDEIYRFKLTAQVPTLHLCKDFTIEQGKNYRYSIQQYNSSGLRSSRILSKIIYADFEDAFLFDGSRQLKIKYNPKIASFKKNLLETKTDTIGGKHPFIFRNGRVYYSEFSISGLISYQMDEENLFLADYGPMEKTTNLTSDNIAAERIFKMKVLEWLTNGKPKIFRSPSEGNYIVRLMNSSLSPNDTLGRMLHTFSSTAYEIADFNYSTLSKLGFITIDNQLVTSLQWETINFFSKNDNGLLQPVETGINLLNYKAKTIRLNDMMPGDIVEVSFNTDSWEQIKIGITGSYYIDTGMDIFGLRLLTPSTGSMTYSYEYIKPPKFELVSSVDIVEHPAHQFIGEHNILQELLYVWDKNAINEKQELGNWIKNPKLEIVEIYQIDVEKRPLQRVNINDNDKNDPNVDNIQSNSSDPFLMYAVGTYIIDESAGSRPGYPHTTFIHSYYYDAFNNKTYNDEKTYEPYLLLNGTVLGVNETEKASYLRPGTISQLESGNGILVTLSYQLCNIRYNIEDEALMVTNPDHYLYKLGQAMKRYDEALQKLKDQISEDSNATEVEIMQTRLSIQQSYDQYIIELVAAQEEDLRRRGVIE